jgi:hypothetical protein
LDWRNVSCHRAPRKFSEIKHKKLDLVQQQVSSLRGWNQKDQSSKPVQTNSLLDFNSKVTGTKCVSIVAQVIEHLLYACEGQGSNLNSLKKRYSLYFSDFSFKD